jgi:cytidine deaminase
METVTYSNLNETQKRVLDAATVAMENAYNPYSNFFVGAALLTNCGELITGANVENAAYGSSICAERSAILRANAMGHRSFEMIAINTRGHDFDTTEPSAPCGSCRQVLSEFSQVYGKDLGVILSTTKKDKIIVTSISELLPLAFGPRDVGVNLEKYRR